MERDELAAWLRLLGTPGIGSESARRLLATFASPQAVFQASEAALRRVVSATQAAALAAPPADLPALLDTTTAWLAASADRHLLALGDPAYPALLLATADPPLLLYAQGRLDWLRPPAVAVVGSRNPTRPGADHARAFAAALSQAGQVVVSGLALGIDGAAHEGALDAGGATIAVVGTGLDRVYPARHQALAHRIAGHGLLLSEYPLGTPPLAANFPRRNRIISGLAQGTLVVEAALQSGSLITARMAAEQGREVFAIPGSIHSPQSRGCHLLIKQGAKLVESAADILEELQAPAAPATAGLPQGGPEGDDGDPVLAALGWEPGSLDALVARTGWPAAELSARLLELELSGQVARLPGQLFQRIASA
ncbi:DNA-processing protein DprA [Eleftheria terrae]|uniref:DNA-processing protein DprA n=1 Tax=Eleftheria terrae TaxID=1597781 RepID=UPI00263B2000|nr:DNA-processing protein DprA [Eleftheria terrae]WKB55149.1 DNA-processing protein DprA [Eleftheria terrae]